jgi:hypothetical protein
MTKNESLPIVNYDNSMYVCMLTQRHSFIVCMLIIHYEVTNETNNRLKLIDRKILINRVAIKYSY